MEHKDILLAVSGALGGKTGGETYFTNPITGAIYPRILDQELTKWESASSYGTRRWYACDHMEEATIRGIVGTNTQPSSTMLDCVGLRKLTLPDIGKLPNAFASGCTALEEVQLGSIDNPITGIGTTAFANCIQEGLTITVYVDLRDTNIPLDNEPWGATNATIVYRSSVTGEVVTPR